MPSNMILIKVCYSALYGADVCTREGFYKAYRILCDKHQDLFNQDDSITRMLHLTLIHLGFDVAVEVARNTIYQTRATQRTLDIPALGSP